MWRILLTCSTFLFLLAFNPLDTVAQEASDVIINELHYRAHQPSEEFVELYNRSTRSVDLSNFQISDDRMNPVPITDEPFELAPGGFAVLVRDGVDFRQAFPGVPFVEPDSWPILRQTGDSSVLYQNGVIVDSIGYEPAWGGYDADTSLERIDPSGPSDHPSNFGSSDGPPTPGQENSIFRPNVEPPEPIFAAADERSIEVHFDEPLAQESVTPSAFTLPGQGEALSAVLSNSRIRVDLQFPAVIEDHEVIMTGVRDFAGNKITEASVKIAFPPSSMDGDHSGDLVINEIMYQPKLDEYDGKPDQVEYIELFNNSDRLVNLSGIHRTDRANQHGEADTTFFDAELLAVGPGEYALIHARRDGVELQEAFPESASALEYGTSIQRSRVTLGLRASGDLIKLHRSDGGVVDSVHYSPDWHHRQIQDTRGISLERVWASGNPNDPNNWTSSLHPDGGTPMMPNAADMDIQAPEERSGITITPQTFTPEGGGEHSSAAITYRLDSDDAMVRVSIFDTMGRLVRNLEAARPAGRFEDAILWDGRDESGHVVRLGIYVVHLEAVFYDRDSVEHYRAPVVVADPF